MGLFDRLFGKKEEPKIEDIVKEALENLDLSEEVEENQTAVEETAQEETTREKVEETSAQEEIPQISTEEVIEPELVEETAQEELELESDELEQFQESEEILEEENQETEEELASEVVEEELPQVEETVQEKYDRSLKKTRTGFGARLNAFFANFRSVDEEFFEELEELLIMSDVGVQVASNLTEELRYEAKLENAKKPDALRRVIIEKLVELYEKDGNYDEQIHFQDGLTVMLFVGVNGVGKTTSIGKLAHRYKQAGKKVYLGAADTFRAAAVERLQIWGDRVGVPVIKQQMGADPASVAFDTLQSAKANGADVVIIDTAGRLHNKVGLMNELKKIKDVMKKVVPEAPHEVLLVLDGSTGQNAFEQARQFAAVTQITSLAITKLDGTAKGGVVIGISDQLKVPVKYIGLGEGMEDLQLFDKTQFVDSLFK